MVRSLAVISSFALAIGLAAPALAQQGYQTPPQAVTDIVTRAPSPGVSVSPDGTQMLLLERVALPPVADLAKPMEKLAGLRLDPSASQRAF